MNNTFSGSPHDPSASGAGIPPPGNFLQSPPPPGLPSQGPDHISVTPPVGPPTADARGMSPVLPLGTPPQGWSWITRHRSLAIALGSIIVVLGTAGSLFAFTNLRYRLPFFQKANDELTQKFYEELSKLDGVDFDLTYSLGVGKRDADVKTSAKDEPSEDPLLTARQAAKDAKMVADARAYVLALVTYFDEHDSYPVCPDQAAACDPSTIPGLARAFGGTVPAVPEGRDPFSYRPTLDQRTTGATSFEIHFSLKVGVSGFPAGPMIVTPNEGVKSASGMPAPTTVDSPVADFFENSFLDDLFRTYEESIPSDLKVDLRLTGRGFSLKQRGEGTSYPDMEATVTGRGEFNATTMELDLAGRVVDDVAYYRVNKFPFIDISQGHQGEWIQLQPEATEGLDDFFEFTDEQVKVIDAVRRSILKAGEMNVLKLEPTGKTVTVDGVRAREFSVAVQAGILPDWFVEAGKIFAEASGKKSGTVTEDNLTTAERTMIIQTFEKLLEHVRITVALHPGTGALMNLHVDVRTLPPASSKKFADQQFNSAFDLRLWNHNHPSRIVPPNDFTEQAEIDREKLGLSKDAYRDWQQAGRVESIRRKLAEFYVKEERYPDALADVTSLTMDLVSGQPFRYQAQDRNYELVYRMHGAPVEPSKDDDSGGLFGRPALPGFSYNPPMPDKEVWHAGNNTADRFSPAADRWRKSRDHVTAAGKTDYDAIVALKQREIAQRTRLALEQYFAKNNRQYPSSVSELREKIKVPVYERQDYLLCEDLLENASCAYELKIGTPKGKAYRATFHFGLASTEIDEKWLGYSYDEPKTFTAGENIITNVTAEIDPPLPPVPSVRPVPITPTTPDPSATSRIPTPTATSHYRGVAPETAEVVLVEYADLQCPYCAQFQDTLKELLAQYPGKVSWVFRHLPLESIHPQAKLAAKAAECVSSEKDEAAFWIFVDAAFARQASLSDATVRTLALETGVDETGYDACMANAATDQLIAASVSEAQAAGASGTPTTFLLVQNDAMSAQILSGALPLAQVMSQIELAAPSLRLPSSPPPAMLDSDADGLNDALEGNIGTDPNKKDTDGDGFDDRVEYINGYNPNGDGLYVPKPTTTAVPSGAWSSCVNLSTLKTCAAYCQSVGQACVDDGTTTTGATGYGAETWTSGEACSLQSGRTGYNSCSFETAATDARWKCFCR